MQLTLPAYLGRSALRAWRLSPWMIRLSSGKPELRTGVPPPPPILLLREGLLRVDDQRAVGHRQVMRVDVLLALELQRRHEGDCAHPLAAVSPPSGKIRHRDHPCGEMLGCVGRGASPCR